MSRLNYPFITNFKTNDFLTQNLQINGSIYDSNGYPMSFSGKTVLLLCYLIFNKQ